MEHTHHDQLTERFLAKELSTSEEALFHQTLASDPEQEEKVFVQKMIQDTVSNTLYRKFQDVLKAVDEAFHLDLDALFAEVPHYESLILVETRSGSAAIKLPENQIDCSDGKITFELGNASVTPLKLTIENNQEDILLQLIIPPHITSFSLDLPKQQFKPGRYYWKLKGLDCNVIRSFFVDKNLMGKQKRSAG